MNSHLPCCLFLQRPSTPVLIVGVLRTTILVASVVSLYPDAAVARLVNTLVGLILEPNFLLLVLLVVPLILRFPIFLSGNISSFPNAAVAIQLAGHENGKEKEI